METIGVLEHNVLVRGGLLGVKLMVLFWGRISEVNN